LGELEVEVIELFVGLVRVLGLPKSVGEIYGFLYLSPGPVVMDEVVGRLRMSKGSASQGLKFLRHIGAVRPVYVAGDRRDYYEAVVELKQLAAGFIRGELVAHLESGERRLARLRGLAEERRAAGGGEFEAARVWKIGLWQERAREVLPLVMKLLD
jgi:DNA-binding transcriptional regulator GbsR (MarR family)